MKRLFKKVKGLFGTPPVVDSAEESLAPWLRRIVSVAGESYLVGVRETKKTRVNTDALLSCRTGVSKDGLQYISDYQFELSCNGHKKVTWNKHYGPTDQELVEFVIDAYSPKGLIKKGKEGLIARASSLPPPTKDIVLAMFSSLGSGRFSFSKQKDTKTNWNTLLLEDKLLRLHYCLDTLQTTPYDNYSGEKSTPILKITFSWEKTGTINLTNEEMGYIEKLIEWFTAYEQELNKLKVKRKKRKEQRVSNALRKQLSNMYGEEK